MNAPAAPLVARLRAEIADLRQQLEEYKLEAREEGARLMQAAASEACLDVWQKADNVRPTYTQNAVSHGCLASSKAIHALSITEVLKGKP